MSNDPVNEVFQHYKSLHDFYKSECEKAEGIKANLEKVELFGKLQKCKEQEDRILYLESLLASKISPPKEEFPSLEKSLSVPEEVRKSETISRISINPSTKLCTFAYIADAKNPPVPSNTGIYLVGELTKGKLIELKASIIESNRTVYVCKLMVEPGYKYTFCFKIGDSILTDVHYPIYRTRYGYNLNWVFVATDRKGSSKQALTFVDNSILGYERKKLEALYKKVMNAGELPVLKEVEKKTGKYYYAVEEPYGILKLLNVNLESK